MEKLSDIKSVKDINYKLKVSYEEALKNDTFKELINSINLSDEVLMKYTSKIEDSALEYSISMKL